MNIYIDFLNKYSCFYIIEERFTALLKIISNQIEN